VTSVPPAAPAPAPSATPAPSPPAPADSARAPRRRAAWYRYGEAASLGIEMAIAVAVGTFGGLWLEARLGGAPWTALAGVLTGIGAAAVAVVRTVTKFHADLGAARVAARVEGRAADGDPHAPGDRAR